MLDFPPWKVWSIVATIVLGFIFAAPNFLTEQQAAQLPSWLPHQQLNLGLDLRGGSHLMLEASTDDVRKAKLEALEETVRSELRQVVGRPDCLHRPFDRQRPVEPHRHRSDAP